VANQGSAEAESFEKRLAPFLEYAYRFAFGVLQKREEAEDAVQIAALKAWRSYASFDPDRDFRPWFVSIVYNECRSLRRSRWWSTLIVPHFGRQHDATPDHLEIGLDVRRALGRLRTVDRSAVVLRYYFDLPFHEVAKVLGTSEPAVRARTYRALKALRVQLDIREEA
jgi:RNA polymerase sigma-70 factor, ECF subfamily